jgi:Contractile injection system tube protein
MNSRMVKARLEEAEGAKKLEFKFNPSEYSVSKTANWSNTAASKGTKAGSKPHYVGSNPQSVSLKIFFDDWEALAGDVTKDVEQLLDWCTPTQKSIRNKKSQPPILKFTWGSNLHLQEHKFYLSSVNATYVMFRRDGTPVRATADIKLSEVPTDDPEGQNPTSGSINTRRTHLISQGDSLQSIANSEYGKPGLWRGIAAFNDLDDPMRLQLGSRLLLPSLEEAAELAR